jgi:rubrerythrin
MKPRIAMFVVVVAALCFTAGRLTATDDHPKASPKTMENLSKAMHGEAFAYAKYLLFAAHAKKNGNTELADLFEKTAAVERMEHLSEEAELAGVVGSDAENLKDSINGESYETETMYREFAQEARAAGDRAAADRFEEIRRDEAKHRDAFKAALDKLQTKHVAVK